MLINADFTRTVVVEPSHHDWVPSPRPGVDRVMLDRIGGEVARATSLVRYAPGSAFPAHAHPGGEEILVLSGTFSDGGGDYPAGWYLRNPPGSHHAPASGEGTLIFVKLGQMANAERQAVRIDTSDPSLWRHGLGRSVCALFAGAAERVTLQRLSPGEPVFRAPVDGAELLLVGGALADGERRFEPGTWMRLPVAGPGGPAAGAAGATLYLKTGHLPGMRGSA